MPIIVKLFGTLRRFSDPATPGLWQADLPEGTRVEDLIARIGADPDEVATVAISGEIVSLDSQVPQGSIVYMVTNVNGG